jgi:shikimate kinase
LDVTVRSPGSATVINAISTGCGSAFGIELYVSVQACLKPSKTIFKTEKGVDTALMEICVRKVLEKFNVTTGIKVQTSSNLPVASGLSSSSATSNAVVMATYRALVDDGLVSDNSLDDYDLINMAIDASLEAGLLLLVPSMMPVPHFLCLTITHNPRREILYNRPWRSKVY